MIPGLVDFTVPFRPSSYLTVQMIDDKKNVLGKQSFYDLYSIFAPSESFFAFWFGIFLFVLIVSTFLLRFTSKNVAKFSSFFETLLDLPTRTLKPNAFGIYFIFFILYIFLILDIIQNNVKTLKLLVDTSQLITSEERLIRTKKEVCFLEESQETDFFRVSIFFRPKSYQRIFTLKNFSKEFARKHLIFIYLP